MIPPPIISILIPPGRLYSQNTIQIEGSAAFSKCVLSRGSMSFYWSVATSDAFSEDAVVPNLNSASAKLTISAGTLKAGTTYYVRLVASLSGAGEATEVRTLVIEQSPLVAKIAGGDSRLASVTGPVTVDATPSFDPDLCEPAVKGEMQAPCADPSLQFAWTCTVPSTGSMCRRVADDVALSLGDGATAAVDLPSLPSTLTAVTISVTVYKISRSSTHSITIELTTEPVLQVSINVLKASAARLLLESQVASSSQYTCRWEISGERIPAKVDYLLPPYNDVDFVRTGWQAATLSLILQSAAASKILSPGTTHTLVLSCTSAEQAIGKSAFSWRVPLPPWGGTCRVSSPQVTVALTDSVIVSCSTWSAEELPIRYSFGIGMQPAGPGPMPEISYAVRHFLDRSPRVSLHL